MWETTDALAVAATGPAPRPELRGRILAAAKAEPQVVVPFARPRSLAAPVLGAAAALAAVVALAVGLWGAGLSNDLDETRAALERERAAAAVLADPEARSIALQEGAGRLVVGSDGRAVLVLDELAPAPDGKTYEAWIASRDVAPQPAGIFSGEEARDIVLVDGRVEPGQSVLVTLEQAGGVDAPTTDPIVGSQPV